MAMFFDIRTIRALVGQEFFREQKQFTLQELSSFDGSGGKPAYVAVEGIVYDVSTHPGWGGGTHFGLVAGRDLTQEFKGCHGMIQILSKLPKIGVIRA